MKGPLLVSWGSGQRATGSGNAAFGYGPMRSRELLAEVPDLGVESAQQIIAEIGPTAQVFHSEEALASWVGVCPGEEVSAGESSRRSPQDNRALRRQTKPFAGSLGQRRRAQTQSAVGVPTSACPLCAPLASVLEIAGVKIS